MVAPRVAQLTDVECGEAMLARVQETRSCLRKIFGDVNEGVKGIIISEMEPSSCAEHFII